MPDPNELMKKLAAQAGDPQAVEKLYAALSTPEGRHTAQVISAENADDLERAAQAAQRGDMGEAARIAQKMMRSKEGASLAARIREIFGK